MSDFKAGDRVRATEDYYDLLTREQIDEAREKGGLFGEVVDENAVASVFIHVKWEGRGFFSDYDVVFSNEIEVV